MKLEDKNADHIIQSLKVMEDMKATNDAKWAALAKAIRHLWFSCEEAPKVPLWRRFLGL